MLAVLAALLLAPCARAQDPVTVGVVKDAHETVVQPILYRKTDTTEVAGSVGLMPFDVYTVAPTVQVEAVRHLSESLGVGGVLGLGYGLKTATYRHLEADQGVAPYAFRYLGSVLAGVVWSPVYAKANLEGARIVHFDVYLAGRGGVTLERSVIPGGGMPICPTLSPAVGTRIFLGQDLGLHLELRDDVLLEKRKLTRSARVKQNAAVLAGVSFFARKAAK